MKRNRVSCHHQRHFLKHIELCIGTFRLWGNIGQKFYNRYISPLITCRDSNSESLNSLKLYLLLYHPAKIPKIRIFPLSTVEKFKFSEFLLDDKGATYLSS